MKSTGIKQSLKPWSQDRLIATGAYPGFCSMRRLEVFLLPLDGMLVQRRSLPRNLSGFPQQFAVTHLYTWVERGTVRVKCLAQEHNTISLARARTRTARSRVEHTNHEATALIFSVMFRLSVLLLTSMSKLIHNRCTCELIIKTLPLHMCMQTNNSEARE